MSIEYTNHDINENLKSDYFPDDFGHEAPVEMGIESLKIWLNDNMPKCFEKSLTVMGEALIPENTPVNVRCRFAKLIESKASVYSDVLMRYMLCVFRIHELRNDGDNRAESMYEEWRKGMSFVIDSLQLNNERNIIDDLFEQASAIKVETSS